MFRRLKQIVLGVGLFLLANLFERKQAHATKRMGEKVHHSVHRRGSRPSLKRLSLLEVRMMRKLLGLCVIIALAIIMLALLSNEAKSVQVVPYISVVPLPEGDSAAGRVECELGGMPIIGIHPKYVGNIWVLYHEAVHARQALNHAGGCRGYVFHIIESNSYRLEIEMEAYCEVFAAQLKEGVTPKPSKEEIVVILSGTFYGSRWTKETVQNLLPCGGSNEPTPLQADGTRHLPQPWPPRPP